MNLLVFDIETIPDLDGGRRLYDLHGLSDADVARVMFHKRREETGGSEFLRHHLQRVVTISLVLRHREGLRVWSLSEPELDEAGLIQRFFDGIEKFTPTLVSWNGGGFDLPVLHYRSLRHGLSCARYWDAGEDDKDFKWNNYLNRYHARHTDLMDVLSNYQRGAAVPLHELAVLLGFPGKLGMSGGEVWTQYCAGNLPGIRDYCEIDVINTYLVYLRFELLRGNLDRSGYERELALLRRTLTEQDKAHFRAFLGAWDAATA